MTAANQGERHIELRRIAVDGARRRLRQGFGGDRRHQPAQHGAELATEAHAIIRSAARRGPVLGVDPRLVLVVDIEVANTRVSAEEEWARSGLRVVDSSVGQRVIAFSDDDEMTTFLSRLRAYSRGPQEGATRAFLESFFDRIRGIRAYGPQDRQGVELQRALATDDDHASTFVVDVELWYPVNEDAAVGWLETVTTGVIRAGGEVLDAFLSNRAGLIVLRVRAEAALVRSILDIDLVAQVELIPRKSARTDLTGALSVNELGHLQDPTGDEPVVGLVDSGVLVDHPLLRAAIVDSVSATDQFPDGIDRHGHGTEVASLLIHGRLDDKIGRQDWPAPLCTVLSVRILNDELLVPATTLAETELDAALRYLARNGVRVVNLSLGDDDSILLGGRATRLAALLDVLARELGLVLVVPTGGVPPATYYFPFDSNLPSTYPQRLLDDCDTGLSDPAPAALALTVGSIVANTVSDSLSIEILGRPGWPSPFTRRGPGIGGAIKPELVASGGSLGMNRTDFSLLEARGAAVLVADGRFGTSGLVKAGIGASLASPLVTRIVSATEGRYPAASANLLRAIVLQSARTPNDPFPDESTPSPNGQAARRRQLLGYGEPQLHRCLDSDPRDTVLVCQDTISVDDVHLYAIPIPAAFFVSGGYKRGVAVSLAYDPPVRARRIDYLGNRMQFDLIRGLPAQQVLDLFLADTGTDDEEFTPPAPGEGSSAQYTRVSQLPSSVRIDMSPSRSARSLGANQLAFKSWSRAIRPEGGGEFLLVVQNINRWDTPGALQPYALTVRLWVDPELPEIRGELRLRVEEARTRARAQMRVRL